MFKDLKEKIMRVQMKTLQENRNLKKKKKIEIAKLQI